MLGYAFRPATPEDAAFLPAIERAAARLFPPGTIPEKFLDDTIAPETFVLAANEGRLWVATLDADDRPVGFALLRIYGEIAVLAEIDVLPDHGRKGLGRELVLRAAEGARRRGHGALYLTTFSHVPWNEPFYARMGFMRVDDDLPPVIGDLLGHERAVAAGFGNRVAMRLNL